MKALISTSSQKAPVHKEKPIVGLLPISIGGSAECGAQRRQSDQRTVSFLSWGNFLPRFWTLVAIKISHLMVSGEGMRETEKGIIIRDGFHSIRQQIVLGCLERRPLKTAANSAIKATAFTSTSHSQNTWPPPSQAHIALSLSHTLVFAPQSTPKSLKIFPPTCWLLLMLTIGALRR